MARRKHFDHSQRCAKNHRGGLSFLCFCLCFVSPYKSVEGTILFPSFSSSAFSVSVCLSLSLFVLIRIYVSNFPHMYICGYEDVEVTCWWILFRLTCGWCIQHTHGDVFLKVLLDCSFWFINAENACMCIYTCTRQVYDLSQACIHNMYLCRTYTEHTYLQMCIQ